MELGSSWERMKVGAKVVFGDPRLRGLVLLGWLATFWVVPEGLAAPYANGDSTAIGLLLAAQPVGSVVGGLVLSRLVRAGDPARADGLARRRSPALPLLFFITTPPLPVAVVLLVVSGHRHHLQPSGQRRLHAGAAGGAPRTGLRTGLRRPGRRSGHQHRGRRRLRRAVTSPGLVICVAGALGVAGALSLSGAGRRFLSSPSPAVS